MLGQPTHVVDCHQTPCWNLRLDLCPPTSKEQTRRWRSSFILFWKNVALCKTFPALLTCFKSTVIQQSRLFPHEGVRPALCTRCKYLVFGLLQLSTSKNSRYNPPRTTVAILTFTLLIFVQCHPFPLSLLGPPEAASFKFKIPHTRLWRAQHYSNSRGPLD